VLQLRTATPPTGRAPRHADSGCDSSRRRMDCAMRKKRRSRPTAPGRPTEPRRCRAAASGGGGGLARCARSGGAVPRLRAVPRSRAVAVRRQAAAAEAEAVAEQPSRPTEPRRCRAAACGGSGGPATSERCSAGVGAGFGSARGMGEPFATQQFGSWIKCW
jgi:hypothetical protein